MFFRYPDDFKQKELAPGMVLRLVWGDNVMLSYATIGPDMHTPTHSHPHEQAGIIIKGSATLTIGEKTWEGKKGDAFVVPPSMEHGATTGHKGCAVIETFYPIREDYIAEFKKEESD